MDIRSPRSYVRHPASCQILFHGRAAGILMAIPFVLCFTLFGVFNLVGGTVLTIMACKPKFSKKGLELLKKIIHKTDIQLQQQLDPMQVIGIILLLTGFMLVIIGISLGIVACRSVKFEKRRRQGFEEMSMSGVPMSTMTERSSRRTSSLTFSPHTAHRKNVRKKSFPSENIVSPIVEVESEYEEESVDYKSFENVHKLSSPELCNVTFRQSSNLKSRESCSKVTWASDVPSGTNSVEVVAEVLQPSQHLRSDSPKMLLTTDL